MSDVTNELLTYARRGSVAFICRTSATARDVLRTLALASSDEGSRGFCNVQVLTLNGLIGAAAPHPLLEQVEHLDTTLPLDHEWRAILADRPGLRRELADQLAVAHGSALVGVDTKRVSAPVRALIEAKWGFPHELEGARRILEGKWSPLGGAIRPSARPRGTCVAIGFGDGSFDFLGTVTPLGRAVLGALKAQHLDDAEPRKADPGPVPALGVPDVAAEARAVVDAIGRSDDALVLVSDALAEERIRDALRRNGVSTTDDGSSPLSRHSLASLLVPLLPLFETRGLAPLAARDLLRLLTAPVLSRGMPGVEKGPRASVRHIRELIANARRAHATVDKWHAAIAEQKKALDEELAAAPPELRERAERRVASAAVLLEQVSGLHEVACSGGRLRDLARFVERVGLASPADLLGRAIVQALDDEGVRPASEDAYRDALAGAVGSRRVDRGVQILTYAEYDGRSADLLLLTGVHDKGLTKAPPPNPFLTDAELEALGLPLPSDIVRGRLTLARWAASRARRKLAVVSDTDASARRVSPPVELALTMDETQRANAYGLRFGLVERRDQAALVVGSRGAADGLSRQVDAEWARGGAVFEESDALPEIDEAVTPLEELLPPLLSRIPKELQPLLGSAGVQPGSDSALPERFTLSAKRMESFAGCLFKGFAQWVLRIKPVDTVEEDLDAREVGSAVHRAMQESVVGLMLVVPQKKLEAARKELVRRLQKHTPRAIADEADDAVSVDSEALDLARQGLASRWNAHWVKYAERRIDSVEAANAAIAREALKELKQSPLLDEIVALLFDGAAESPRKTLRSNLSAALEEGVEADQFFAEPIRLTEGLAARNVPLVEARLKSERKALRKKLEEACGAIARALSERGYHDDGDLEVVACELPFGDFSSDGESGAPLGVTLGASRIGVHGSIDAVLLHRGRSGEKGTRYRVVDFKTGRAPGAEADVLLSLIKPQLPFYAAAVEAMGPLVGTHPVPLRVNGVAYDPLLAESAPTFAVTPEDMTRIREVFGKLLEHARAGTFPPIPHPKACPLYVERGGYCDFADVCRARPRSEEA